MTPIDEYDICECFQVLDEQAKGEISIDNLQTMALGLGFGELPASSFPDLTMPLTIDAVLAIFAKVSRAFLGVKRSRFVNYVNSSAHHRPSCHLQTVVCRLLSFNLTPELTDTQVRS
jgi:hypothetical protein